jgi:thiol-disulfide isomerase/thioredoxin
MVNKWLVGMLVLSVAYNVYQNRVARYITEDANRVLARHSLAVGDDAPPLTVQNISGGTTTISFGASSTEPTIVYFFAPDCVWCEANEPNIRRLASETRGKYRFVGVSGTSSGLDEYLKTHQVDFPVYVLTRAAAKEFKVLATPTTLVLSPEGRVLRNWRGAFRGPTRDDVEKFFLVRLPG